MIEKTSTMQSEGAEDTPTCLKTPPIDKMTFSTANVLSPENLVKTEPLKSQRLRNINLEDDIEKVEVDSQQSSSTPSESDKPEFIPIPDFSSIPAENPNESVKNWLNKINEIQNNAAQKKSKVAQSVSAPARVVKYQDLPYMGEITLDNSKPRRGRKPKKADICHLIYKNYGTIFPGTPNPNSYLEKQSPSLKKNLEKETEVVNNKSDVQSKIISSLLEKRLTQETRKSVMSRASTNQHEPLNLCIRDLNHLKIDLLNKSPTPEVKSEPHSDDEVELVTETSSPSLTVKGELRFPSVTPDSTSTSSPSDTPNTPEGQPPGGYVYWPNNNLFIHPMALQQQLMMYQRLAGNMNYTLPSHSPRPPPPASTNQPKSEATENLRKIVPKSSRHHHNHHQHADVKSKRSASLSEKNPAKRKRSAIFIPPIPTENTTNPATEVSICKFKFTGGAKPSLQEKKMLSVDSGGNFRYYSGTGDKSMRGYEFFPRETLQQQVTNTQGSSTGAFLQASGEKIYPAPPLEITGGTSTSDFLLTPDLPGSSLASPQSDCGSTGSQQQPLLRSNKKRKSRKSMQREKLEQTFKEKGFLIQTQQLESAEGATYCKFRQLRKFTRYLFRSWKDYLPGNVRELSENEQRELQGGDGGPVELPTDVLDISMKTEDVPS
ncbi:uncharacterized protein LOC126741120 isoform X1 [Anthonomus grandis grandis]|uniref:uncharacterized protein LOC126741120 isoform X1 n=2 Tax=Anthonomus grandis grandis TaxID=2921223 RepID=UPI0021668F90|nr:uncharacterized protein LOC126741120 isoform X1 [Anthonomus grandis grandis]